jgi:hypothetical protein
MQSAALELALHSPSLAPAGALSPSKGERKANRGAFFPLSPIHGGEGRVRGYSNPLQTFNS